MMMQSLERRMLLTAVSGVVFGDTVVVNGKADAGEGLAGCVVTFNNNADHTVSTPVTAGDGSFATDLAPGSWHLTIDGPGVKKPYDVAAFVVGTNPIAQNFKLEAEGTVTPPAAKADIAVSISQVPNLLTVGGKGAPVTVTVTNGGGAYTGPLTADLYFSKNKTIEPTDYHVVPALSFPVISIGRNATKRFQFDASVLAAVVPVPGKFYVLAKVTVKDDANVANNTASTGTAATVSRGAPNLVPTIQGTPVAKGKALPFTLVVKNAGDAAATGPAGVSLAAQAVGSGKLTALPSLSLKALALAAGAGTKPAQLSANLSGLAAGSYKLVVTLTATLSAAESNTKDNKVVSAAFTVK